MSYARILCCVAVAIVSTSCTWAVTRDELLANAPSRIGEFAGDYQTLALCFDDERTLRPTYLSLLGQGAPADRLQMRPDLKLAEYRNSSNGAWFQLIQFRALDSTRTEVRAYSANPDWLDSNWKTIERCANDRAPPVDKTR